MGSHWSFSLTFQPYSHMANTNERMLLSSSQLDDRETTNNAFELGLKVGSLLDIRMRN